MKFEELEIYSSNRKPPSNFISLEGFENEYFKVISRAPNKGEKVHWNCLCKSCGEYCVKSSQNLKRDKSCGCSRNKNIGKALRKDLTGKRFGKLIAVQDTGRSNSVGCAVWHCICDCGNECDVDSNNLTSNHTQSCGCINGSIGADNIEKLLDNNNIIFSKEYSFSDLYDKSEIHKLKFDFCILDNFGNPIRLIEYDGIQHFIPTWGKWGGTKKDSIQKLNSQQRRDNLKNQYAKEHNIPLVRIPYWERDNITLDMIMGDQYLIK